MTATATDVDQVLLYAGQMDATLGPMSLHAAVKKIMTMPEPVKDGWQQKWTTAPKLTWRLRRHSNISQIDVMGKEDADVCGKVHDVAGFVHSIQVSKDHNFTVATVLNAGHLAPGNQPASSLDMIERFVDGAGFASS